MPIKKEDFDKPLNPKLKEYLKKHATASEMKSVSELKGIAPSSMTNIIYRGRNFKNYHAPALTALIRIVNKRIEVNGYECEEIKELFNTYL